jgi:N-acetylated-alpha-linked acidic dipeptidase
VRLRREGGQSGAYTRRVPLPDIMPGRARLTSVIVLLVVAAACARTESETPAARIRLGYTAAASAATAAVERRFADALSAESMAAQHQALTARPHPTGSPASAELAGHLRTTLEGFGLEVKVHEYQVLHSKPRRIALTMTAPTNRPLSLDEPAIPGDPTSSHPELRGGYVSYSASGTASGQIVYVNYGLPPDYEQLKKLGVSAKDKIVVARYGRSHRAVKTHTAQQAGARALILYSDPADDGEVKGPAWPNGYWRGEQMLQRGNAKYSWYWHGDPLTPGVAATAGAPRIDEKTAPTLPKIPVVPISWGEAQHLLSALKGPEAPAAFTGGLPFTYHVGPGPAAATLLVDMEQKLGPIYDVVATLRGSTTPERSVLLGTHHDAWTFGGVDPGTGTTAMLEVARSLGAMAKAGWRPARTISLAFWDAEELGLVGSTEYAEELRAQLQEQLIMYVNIDMYMKGRFDPGGVPSLRAFVADVAKDIPEGEGTVYDGWQRSEFSRRPAGAPRGDVASFSPDLKPLGSGADFVPFQDHLGVPTMAIEYIGDNGYGYGTYHTNYDSRAYVEQIADPGFHQGVQMARVLGTTAIRMSEATVLPFRFSHYATRLQEAIRSAEGWAKEAGAALDVSGLRTRAERVAAAATSLEAAIDRRLASGELPAAALPELNDRLARMEQKLADDEGAPETKWYRHGFYGWNIYAMYDGQPFPGLAEALRVKDDARVTREVGRIERALDRMKAEIEAAAALVG